MNSARVGKSVTAQACRNGTSRELERSTRAHRKPVPTLNFSPVEPSGPLRTLGPNVQIQGMRLVFRWAAAFALLALALTAAACGGGGDNGTAAEGTTTAAAEPGAAPDPGDCSAEIDNPLAPISSLSSKVFEGSEKNPETDQIILTRSEQTRLEETDEIAGYPVTAVEAKGYEDGAQVDKTIAYYTQCGDGSVWFVGEKSDEIEDGEVVASDEWQAGVDGAQAGLLMPADPKVGDTYQPERVPDVSETRSKVLQVGVSVTTKAGKFTDCIKTEDFSPLDEVTEFKWHCPRVGSVREQADGLNFDLLRYS